MQAYQQGPSEDPEMEAVRRLETVSSSAILRYISKLRRQFAKYAVSPEETRRLVDEGMGNNKLTDVLDQMRRERP